MKQSGFSIVEFLFAIAITTIVGFAVSWFAKEIISINSSAQSSMTALLESRKILQVMVTELRSTSPSALGSYPIGTVSTSSIIFFSDVNFDNVTDRVRYFLDPNARVIKRGVVLAIGEPPAYNLGQETFSTLISDVSNGVTPVFDYYDGNYTGTSAPLPLPVNVQAVRLIKITVNVERDPNRGPGLITVTSQASLRNLKDNL